MLFGDKNTWKIWKTIFYKLFDNNQYNRWKKVEALQNNKKQMKSAEFVINNRYNISWKNKKSKKKSIKEPKILSKCIYR